MGGRKSPDPEPLRHYGTATYITYTNREIVSSVCCESPCRMFDSVRVGSIPGHFSNHQRWRWPMTREEFRAKWSARRAEWEKPGVSVSGAKICEEFIADFENVLTSHDEAVLNTNQAAAMTGYSRAQLLHLYKQGKLRGHKNGKHVFFRASDLPRKPNGGRPVVAPSSVVIDEETRVGARRLAARLGMRRAQHR